MLKKRKSETKETARGSISGGDADDAALASVLLPYISTRASPQFAAPLLFGCVACGSPHNHTTAVSHMFKWDTPLEVGEQFVRSIGERFSLPADKVKEALVRSHQLL